MHEPEKKKNLLHFPPESLSSLLWNLHKYYSQFLDGIHTKICQLRQPIEKELKVIIYIFLTHSALETKFCSSSLDAFKCAYTLMLLSCELFSSGLCEDLQMERCQFLVHQTVSGENSQVRHKCFSSIETFQKNASVSFRFTQLNCFF